jgi:hypothetical protein
MKFEEEITDAEVEEIETEAKEVKQMRKPKTPGLMLTIFGAILIVLIGGLASYYYYSFQSQGAAGERVLKNAWSDVTGDTNLLMTKFNSIDTFDNLASTDNTSLTKMINQTNQTVRDGMFDIKAQAGLSIKASTTASKLTGFLEDYSNMLSELKRITARVSDISEATELDDLKTAGEKMEKSYDELLLVGNGYVQVQLPRTVFDIPTKTEGLLAKKIEEGGTKTEQQKAVQQAAEQLVGQFVQEWTKRNPGGMSNKMTTGAKTEFVAGAVEEESSDITGFRITQTTVGDDLGKVTIVGQLDKQTPDKVKTAETWEFVLLKQGESWLIDRWQKKS